MCPHSSCGAPPRSRFPHIYYDLTQARFGFATVSGMAWQCSGGIVGRGGRSRVALPRRPRAALPRAHLLPRRLHQARAAARLACLHRPRLHRRNWRPRRHGVSSIVSYYFSLLFPTAGSLDHIVQCGYLEAVMERFVSRLLCNPKFLLCTPANFSFIWDFGLFGMEESRVSTSLGTGSSCQ